MLLFHVLITYGSKSGGPRHLHPQYVAQMVAHERLQLRYPDQSSNVIWDYARSVARLADLPKLVRLLTQLEAQGQGIIFVDDVSRIFRSSPIGQREDLLLEMQPFAHRLVSLKHGKRLSEFSEMQIHDLMLHAEKMKIPRRPSSPRDTTAAQSASLAARSSRAIALHQKVSALRTEIVDAGGKATLQAIADEANQVGLRTSTGRIWTRQAIKRALDTTA